MTRAAPPFQTVSTGLVVAIVGFFSSFPIVLQGLAAMGASAAQSASGLMMAAIAMGLTAIGLSLWYRQPISVAWSTPGAALLAVSAMPAAGFAEATGAFLCAGALTVLAGLWRPLGRLAAAIPTTLAQAMLGGVLLPLCIVPFKAAVELPWQALPVILTWFIAGRINRLFAVPAAVVAAAIVVILNAGEASVAPAQWMSAPVWTMPTVSLASVIGIGIPLFIVTMATQNIPGIAVMRSFGYDPASGRLFSSVGASSILSAPFGAPATCLAAITAAMCSNEDSHPDPAQRYWSAVMAGVFYCIFGIFAVAITGFALHADPLLMGTLTGIALIGVLANATAAALEVPAEREAAILTFAITASGISVFGLGAAVWGLLAGGLAYLVSNRIR
ncbi:MULTISPECIES: benzoate/H(+) symporter BenE family transporter [unclassified Ruegeria]|uniref:benzoate/H(+) symporter BenE family transporter n=1 Tax=unclassified Ruegeria TaxID=2625375 RepID=UPI001ADA7AEF|nr:MULTISPECIES: benzoate/H(+) symporter BenE family transporter [unclassified Ruegeria]MBO9410094.1 benzoate/H(+) symporter BenE family transporter [Ruegeria sp. R8_1]MBO9414687.1 benzoate/H(+) symporter BenE family transporter [Ruegeria sp. R8_2]